MDLALSKLQQRAQAGDPEAERLHKVALARLGRQPQDVKPAKPIIYNSYWGTWNRILRYEGIWTVELNLTPINHHWPSTWGGDRSPSKYIIRKHGTAVCPSDKLMDELPGIWRDLLVYRLGEEITTRLLTFDFYPLIDWMKYDRVNNGGAPISEILKDGERLPWEAA